MDLGPLRGLCPLSSRNGAILGHSPILNIHLSKFKIGDIDVYQINHKPLHSSQANNVEEHHNSNARKVQNAFIYSLIKGIFCI